jgi:hypothetical protein
MPPPLKSLQYSWYIMPEGGAYVYDSWVSPLLYNPNIVVLHKYEPGFGRGEGKTGRPVTLDHPLHVALFDNNTQMDPPPHLRTLSVNNPLQPPLSCTPCYPIGLDTVLHHTLGDIESLRNQIAGMSPNEYILQRVAVESNQFGVYPNSPPDANEDPYDPDEHRRLIAALPQHSSPSREMDEYGNIIGESEEVTSHT